MIVSTPGVYINEINTLPQSIAGVSTAVPAFIGFTELDPMEPVRITNLQEFEASFGGKYQPKFKVSLGNNNEVTGVIPDRRFFLYDSLELYFKNGGGPCYVLSSGKFEDFGTFISNNDIADALSIQLTSLDVLTEVTVISIPDLSMEFKDSSGNPDNLSDQFGDAFLDTINKCGTLKDKFAIFDFPSRAMESDDLRDEIPISENRMYGAMYYPWLKRSKSYSLRMDDVTIQPIPSPSDHKINYDNIKSDYDYMVSNFGSNMSVGSMKDIFNAFEENIPSGNGATAKEKFSESIMYIINLIIGLDTFSPSDLSVELFREGLKSNNSLKAQIKNLFRFKGVAHTENLIFAESNPVWTGLNDVTPVPSVDWYNIDSLNDNYSTFTQVQTNFTIPSFDVTSPLNAYGDLPSIIDLNIIFRAVESLFEAIEYRLIQMEKALFAQDPIYSNIQKAVENYMQAVPSQGAIAGIYCKTDRERGVWKSPANVAVMGITKPLVEVSNAEQNDLNIHESGKSINVIRTFTGKGSIVWGARTLAGNSNEWRYISVRRFFNFAETSIKRSLADFVFEPNNARTHVKIKAMVMSFLVSQWQAGALVGTTMKEAFFVHVEESTTTDGTVDVQVGLAVVRPAEFIILTFSHKTNNQN